MKPLHPEAQREREMVIRALRAFARRARSARLSPRDPAQVAEDAAAYIACGEHCENEEELHRPYMHAFHAIWTRTVGAPLYRKEDWRQLCRRAERAEPGDREVILDLARRLSRVQGAPPENGSVEET